MSPFRSSLVLLPLAGLALAGCGPSSPAKSQAPPAATTSPAAPAPAAHHHEHAPPHGGTLVELGEEFAHVEVVFDRAAGRLTVYLLDGEAEAPVRTRQAEIAVRLERLAVDGQPLSVPPLAVTLEAVASPLTGDVVGDASQFEGAHEAIRGHARIRGVLERVEVRGQPFEQVAFDLKP